MHHQTRLVVLESGLGLESGLESIFAGLGLGLGLEMKGLGLGLGLATYRLGLGLELGSFFRQVLLQVHFTKCTCGEGVHSRGYCTIVLCN